MHITKHAAIRAQQRVIPPLIFDWLNLYGEEAYDGHGGIRRFFSKRSRRLMERDFGSMPVRRLAEFLGTYLVESVNNGDIITVGHETRRRRRR